MRIRTIVFILITCFHLSALVARDVQIRATVEPEKSFPGVAHTYTVAFSAPEDTYTVELPKEKKEDREKGLPLYQIVDTSQERHREDGLFYLTITLRIVYFKPGTYELPMVEIADTDGVLVGYKEPVVEIQSVNTTGKLEDIEAPYERGGNYTRILLLAAAALVLGGLLFLGIRYIRHRLRTREAVIPAVDPEQLFFDELAALQKKKYLENEQIELFCTTLSAIFRRYLMHVCAIPAPDMTTDEIYEALARQQDPVFDADTLRRMMQLWDLAKFAEMRPSPDIIRRNIDELTDLVHTREGGHTDGF